MASFSKAEGAGILHDDVDIQLGALATKDMVSAITKIDGSRAQGFRILKTQIWAGIFNVTVGDGPVMFGLAFNNSVAEIEEAIEADPQYPLDFPAAEQSMRPVWPVYLFNDEGADGQIANDGRPYELNLRWSFPENTALAIWAYNMGGAVMTTGSFIRCYMKHFGVWLND